MLMSKRIILIALLIQFNVSIIRLPLTYENSLYMLNFLIGKESTKLQLALDTSLPVSLIASNECENCIGQKYQVDAKNKIGYDLSNLPKSYNVYQGYLYKDVFTYNDNQSDETKKSFNFVSFKNVSLIKEIKIPGYFSFSYANNNILQYVKLFTLYLGNDNPFLELNEINPEIVTEPSKLVTYKVELINPIAENDNNSNNSNPESWYIQTSGLSIIYGANKQEIKTKPKLIFDTTTWYLSIPKQFFFDNMELLFPANPRCQVQLEGYFNCYCNEKFEDDFPSFIFNFEDSPNKTIKIIPTDYIQYDSSKGNTCYVFYTINYNSDYWITGLNVLNNYYSIFDLEKKTLSFYPFLTVIPEKNNFLLTFLLVAGFSLALLFGGYFLYKKYYVNRINEPEEQDVNISMM